MPRRALSIPAYRKHTATGQAVVTLNGRDVYPGKHGTEASRTEYDRIITEWLASGRSAAYVPRRTDDSVELGHRRLHRLDR